MKTGVWLQAVRPFSLPLSLVPVLLGTLLATSDGRFRPVLFLLTLVGTMAIHTGANLANNYHDYARGLDSKDSFGPARLISLGLVSPNAMRSAMWLAFAIGIVAGTTIAALVGWPILVVGLVSVGTAYFYSAGPRPLAFLGLGEVLVFVFLGLVILEGSYYVQTLQLSDTGIWLGILLGLWATCIVVLNDIRDRDQDPRAGKTTLAVIAGRRWSEREFAVLLFGSYGVALFGAMIGGLPNEVLLVFFSLPGAVWLVRTLRSGVEGWELTRLQAMTSKHYLFSNVLLTSGIVLDIAF